MHILTYNLSWRSMTGDPTSKICNSNDINNPNYYGICQDNVLSVVSKFPYSIIAFQEASHFIELVKKSEKLKTMNYLYHYSDMNDMVTFYDPSIELLYYSVGEFEKGRPYQILYFKKFCFINVHAGHYSKKGLKHKIDTLFKNTNIKATRVIIAGDFNSDLDEKEKFGSYTFYNAKNKINTCCYPNHIFKFDHVIDTKSAPTISTIMDEAVTERASDHLPIIGYL